jgi:hypothetical protein
MSTQWRETGWNQFRKYTIEIHIIITTTTTTTTNATFFQSPNWLTGITLSVPIIMYSFPAIYSESTV